MKTAKCGQHYWKFLQANQNYYIIRVWKRNKAIFDFLRTFVLAYGYFRYSWIGQRLLPWKNDKASLVIQSRLAILEGQGLWKGYGSQLWGRRCDYSLFESRPSTTHSQIKIRWSQIPPHYPWVKAWPQCWLRTSGVKVLLDKQLPYQDTSSIIHILAFQLNHTIWCVSPTSVVATT